VLGIAVIFSLLMLFVPALPLEFMDMVTRMTVGKSDSESAQQRLFWAMQGWEAYKASYGLGIGPGSFRSSSFVMAVIGSTGVIGAVSFLAYALGVLKPLRISTFGRSELLEHSIGGAFAVAAIASLVPSAVVSPKADPGTNFAFLAGAALALRPSTRRSSAAAGDRESEAPKAVAHAS